MADPSHAHRRTLPRDFFARPAIELAPALLGCVLLRTLPDGQRLAGVIVETEAYLGPEDLASHARGNRRTPRTEPMFAQAGTSYVYFTYGMHYCMNIVCDRIDFPAAVLIRALQPTQGLEQMAQHRAGGEKSKALSMKELDLCRGPARLCQALGIDKALNAIDLTADGRLGLTAGEPVAAAHIRRTPRIGVDAAGAWALRPLRFLVAGSKYVSGPRVK